MLTDTDLMEIALEEARKAYQLDEVPVGAVVAQNGMILSQAHNAPIGTGDPSAHAEMLAIRLAAQKTGNYRLTGAELFVTLEPCAMCAGVIVLSRLSRVVFGARDPKSGAVTSLYQLLSDDRLNHRVEITEGVLQPQCSEILSRFFREKRVRADSSSS